MTLLILAQWGLTVVAGFLLFALWRRFIASHPLGWIVTVGFLIRALVGPVLFWISFLKLPFARSLQMGSGLWFFGSDAVLYLPPAFAAADGGFGAIVEVNRTLPSVTFIQVLSLFTLTLGSVASVAILLNLFAFLGSCAIVLRWSHMSQGTASIAIVAMSLSPSAILWSVQPLKDTLFQFLVVSFVATAALYQKAWQSGWRVLPLLAGLGMIVMLFGLAGVRWYYAFAALLAAAVFLALVSFAADRRAAALSVSVVLLLSLIFAFRRGGGPYIPEYVHQLLRPASVVEVFPVMGRQLAESLEGTRRGFERVGGSTVIGAPVKTPRTASVPRPESGVVPAYPTATVASGTAQPSSIIVAGAPVVATEPAANPEVSTPKPAASSARPEVSTVRPEVSTAIPEVSTAKVEVSTAKPEVSTTRPEVSTARPEVSTARPEVSTAKPEVSTARPEVSTAKLEVSMAKSEVSTTKAEHSTPKPPVLAAKPVGTAAVAPAVQPAGESSGAPTTPARVTNPVTHETASRSSAPPASFDDEPLILPASRTKRLFAGIAAIFLPRFLGQTLGLVKIQGGRGLMWFADLDTLFFDFAMIAAMVVFLRSGKRALLRNPLFWLVSLTTLLVMAPLAYAVANFGTLFRLRAMIFIGMALLPLAMSGSAAKAADVSPDLDAAPVAPSTL